eukprot:7500125-Ditylum_brightwellii.AAC.1
MANPSLKGQIYDMGQVTELPAGWFENESMWVHALYTFYLDLLHKGLYTEFCEEMTSGGISFQTKMWLSPEAKLYDS